MPQERNNEAACPPADGADDPALEHHGPDAEPAPAPVACPYCRTTPCRGPEHFAFDVLHHDDPVVAAQRDERATREMFEMLGRPLGQPHLVARVGPRADPLAGLSPEEREREEQAREVRQRLGWE